MKMEVLAVNQGDESLLTGLLEKHLEDLRIRNYSEYTVKNRRVHIRLFLDRRSSKKRRPPVMMKSNNGGLSRGVAMIESMDVVHMTEAEVVRDIAAVLAKVRQGSEIVIEQGNRPMAVIKPSKPVGRMISEVIADLKARGSDATMDEEFARDIEEGIKAHRQPWNPPSWD